MGGAPSAPKTGKIKLFSFEQTVLYLDSVEQSINTITTPLKNFHNHADNATIHHLPRDMLLILFKLQGQISFLGHVARVCQLWYSVATEEDVLWRPFLPAGFFTEQGPDYDHDSLVNRNAKRGVFDYSFTCHSVAIPSPLKAKIQRLKGYDLPGTRSHAKTRSSIYTDHHRVCLLGQAGVGRSSMALRFTANRFPNADEDFEATRKMHQQPIKLNVYVPFDQDQVACDGMGAKILQECHTIMVLYSIDNRESFVYAANILEKFKGVNSQLRVLDGKTVLAPVQSFAEQSRGAEKQYVLVGAKSDLSPAERRVTYREGLILAKRLGLGFVEVSAKNNANVEKTILTSTELYFFSRDS